MRKKPDQKQYTTWLQETTIEELKRVSALTGLRQTDLVDRAIRMFLDTEEMRALVKLVEGIGK